MYWFIVAVPQLQADTNLTPLIKSLGPAAVELYPLENYTFGTKAAHVEKDKSVKARLARMEQVAHMLYVLKVQGPHHVLSQRVAEI